MKPGDLNPDPAGEDLTEPLADGIREIATEYRERFERNPRLVEMLGIFAFVLRPDHPALKQLGIGPGGKASCPGRPAVTGRRSWPGPG